MLFCWPKLLIPYYSLLLFFPFLFFLSIGWYCGAEVIGLIRCISLSLSLTLPTFFNNNNNNKLKIDLALCKVQNVLKMTTLSPYRQFSRGVTQHFLFNDFHYL